MLCLQNLWFWLSTGLADSEARQAKAGSLHQLRCGGRASLMNSPERIEPRASQGYSALHHAQTSIVRRNRGVRGVACRGVAAPVSRVRQRRRYGGRVPDLQLRRLRMAHFGPDRK